MLVTSPLRITHAISAYATAYTDTLVGALYDDYGQRLEEAERRAGNRRGLFYKAAPLVIKPQDFQWKRLPGRSLYMGHWIAHYGHWLIESTAMFWATRRLQYEHMLYHPILFGPTRTSYMETIFAAHDLDIRSVVMIEENLALDYVAVPERSIILARSVHSTEFGRVFDRIRSFVGNVAPQGRKVFISRSKLPKRPREPLNSRDVDDVAARLGFEFIHPETLPFEDQVRLFQETEILCGFNGSGLHNVLFMWGGRVIEIGDLKRPRTLFTQQQCSYAAGVDHVFIPCERSGRGQIHLAKLEASIRAAMAPPMRRGSRLPWRTWQT